MNKQTEKTIEQNIRVVLMNCFDNDRYAWSEAHERLIKLFNTQLQQEKKKYLDGFLEYLVGAIKGDVGWYVLDAKMSKYISQTKGGKE